MMVTIVIQNILSKNIIIYLRSFWNLIKKMDIEGQKRFLFFCTGSDRVPVGGMKSMKFII